MCACKKEGKGRRAGERKRERRGERRRPKGGSQRGREGRGEEREGGREGAREREQEGERKGEGREGGMGREGGREGGNALPYACLGGCYLAVSTITRRCCCPIGVPDSDAGGCYLLNVVVADDLRGQGVGKALMRAAMARAVHAWGAQRLYTHVEADNEVGAACRADVRP